MAAPTRFTSGVSTQAPRSALATYPSLPNPVQEQLGLEFFPYRSGDFTLTQTNGAAASAPWNAAALKLSTTGSTAADKAMLGLASSFPMFFIPGNQLWFAANVAIPGLVAAGSSNDTAVYAGLADNVDVTAASNGVYFTKAASGTTVNLVIKKGGTTTTIQNVADVAKPSGIYGASDVVGVLGGTIAGNALTAINVQTAGSGYAVAPLLIPQQSLANCQAYCQLGSGGLYAPMVQAGGSGGTNGTYTSGLFDVIPWINLSFYYDGKYTLYVGVNGKQVASIGVAGVSAPPAGTVITPGNSYANNSVGPIFNTIGTQLSTSVSPQQPLAGSFINISPLAGLTPVIGLANSTANARSAYFDSLYVANEYN